MLSNRTHRSYRQQSHNPKSHIDIQRQTIRAPFAGVITELHVNPGDRVGPQAPLVTLFDPESLSSQ